MARNITVSSISFRGVGAGDDHKRRTLDQAARMVDLAALDTPDLIVLPETFHATGLGEADWFAAAERADGPTLDMMSAKARQHGCYVTCPMIERRRSGTYNTCILIDPRGQAVCRYDKIHPTIGEMTLGIRPGKRPVVAETAFGRLGFAICFDLNWRSLGQAYKRLGADLMVFVSMFRGGLQTQIWAFDFQCYFVSAVPAEQSVVVDPLGRVLASSSDYAHIQTRRLNLDYQVLHIDYNVERVDAVKRKYGPAVEIETASPEAMYLLTSHHPRRSAEQIVREFKLETVDAYFARADRIRGKRLQKSKPGGSR